MGYQNLKSKLTNGCEIPEHRCMWPLSNKVHRPLHWGFTQLNKFSNHEEKLNSYKHRSTVKNTSIHVGRHSHHITTWEKLTHLCCSRCSNTHTFRSFAISGYFGLFCPECLVLVDISLCLLRSLPWRLDASVSFFLSFNHSCILKEKQYTTILFTLHQ